MSDDNKCEHGKFLDNPCDECDEERGSELAAPTCYDADMELQKHMHAFLDELRWFYDHGVKIHPFAGDTDGDVVLFADKIVTARKPGKCHNCGDPIKPGMRIRSRREKFDGSMVNYKWCDQCTCNMALGNDDALELSRSNNDSAT